MKFNSITFANHTIPTYEIDLGDCDSYLAICDLMRPLGVIKYTYIFKQDPHVIKIGMSADQKSHMPVERVYRLAGNLPGWVPRLSGPSGAEMIGICESYKDIFGIPVNRTKTKLTIFDFTKIPSPNSSDENFLVKKHEWHLLENHQSQFGYLPPGNIKTEEHMANVAYVHVDQMTTHFLIA